MSIDAASLRVLVERELAGLSDARVLSHVRSLLVEPSVVLRQWDYGAPGDKYPCWTVLDDGANSSTGIAYCEYGFGPRMPWGLVWLEADAKDPRTSMGMDGAWFSAFLDAYFDSRAATALPIWRVFRVEPDGALTPLTDEGEWDAAWSEHSAFQSHGDGGRFLVSHSISYAC